MSCEEWAVLAIDNGRLLTEARLKLADAETRAAAAEDAALGAQQLVDDLREQLAFSRAKRERVGAAYADLEAKLADAETQRLAFANQVALATEVLRKEHAAQVAAVKQERDILRGQLEFAWGEQTRLGQERDEGVRIQEGLMRRCALMRNYCVKMRDASRAATARERAAREALLTILQATDLPLPSEQTGSVWDRCVRVPVERLLAIEAALDSVLGEPPLTGEPMPKLHGDE